MKILTTCLSASWGGMEMYALATAKQLLKLNIESEIFCLRDSKLHEECNKERIVTHTSSFRGIRELYEYSRTTKLLTLNKYDVIHSHFSRDLWLLVPVLRFNNLDTSLYLTKHMASGISKKDLLHRWVYARVDKAFAISSMVKGNIIATTPLAPSKVFLLHNGIETKRFDPLVVNSTKVRTEFNIKNDEIIVGMIGRFSPGKGHEEFLSAAKIICSSHSNIRFMIVGEASAGENEYFLVINELAQTLGIKDRIIFTGFRKDTPEVIAAMDIFVFPSRDESFGLTLAEAMSMSRPTICTRASGILDIAVDGETSLLFERENVDQLVEKIETFIKSPELRKNFGLAGRTRAVNFFDHNIYIQKLIEFYKDKK